MKSYYNHKNGTHQNVLERIWNNVPRSGAAPFVSGEMVRAAVRLSHELYNNGMSNNVSGALNYLNAKGVFEGKESLYRIIHEHALGRAFNRRIDSSTPIAIAVEETMDLVLEMIINNPEMDSLSNNDDMLNYAEEDQRFCVHCNIELTDRNSSVWSVNMCNDCHEDAECDFS